MVDINNTPMINSADLAKVVSDPNHTIQTLLRHDVGVQGKHRSIGAGLMKSTGMSRAGGNNGFDISRDTVQRWLDEGKLTLRNEPESEFMRRLYGSPAKFLADNELRDPRTK